jgi:DNA-binding transcriptional LysR family regulator
VLTVPAVLLAKRQEHSRSSDSSSTWYYVTFEMPGQDRVELPVHGHQWGTLVEGDAGSSPTRAPGSRASTGYPKIDRIDKPYLVRMDRRQLEYFLAVAECGSFTRAAAALTIAQPSLSHSIGLLERELGSALFERLGRGVRLTAAGQALLLPARRTVRSFQVAATAVRSVTDVGFGRLTIISNTLWAIEPLVQIIGEYRQAHPAVQFSVGDPVRRSEVLDQVRSGDADFGLIDGTPPAGPLESQWLLEHRLVAVLPPDALPGQSVVGISGLVPLGLICTLRGTALRELLDTELQVAGEASEIAVETAHLASVIPLVLAGAGAALLPEGLAQDAGRRGARVLPLRRPTKAAVHLIWRARGLSSPGEQFLGLAATMFGEAARP